MVIMVVLVFLVLTLAWVFPLNAPSACTKGAAGRESWKHPSRDKLSAKLSPCVRRFSRFTKTTDSFPACADCVEMRAFLAGDDQKRLIQKFGEGKLRIYTLIRKGRPVIFRTPSFTRLFHFIQQLGTKLPRKFLIQRRKRLLPFLFVHFRQHVQMDPTPPFKLPKLLFVLFR